MRHFDRYLILGAILLLSSTTIACDIGEKVPDFTLQDVAGKSYTLSADEDSKAIVMMFISTRCPVSNAYNERMVSLYEDYAPKGISFIAVNSNKQEDIKEIKEHAQAHNFPFRVLKDHANKIADAYEAQVTPEIYVVNGDQKLLYHGRIDNSQREDLIESKDLREALDDILAGKAVRTTETKAFGCTIKRVE